MADDEKDELPRRRQLAIALRYNDDKDSSPRVIAKGAGYVAQRIIEKAEALDIPVRNDPDLVHSLAQLDLGQLIPAELYPAVAEVLAYVYRMNNRRLAESENRSDAPENDKDRP